MFYNYPGSSCIDEQELRSILHTFSIAFTFSINSPPSPLVGDLLYVKESEKKRTAFIGNSFPPSVLDKFCDQANNSEWEILWPI